MQIIKRTIPQGYSSIYVAVVVFLILIGTLLRMWGFWRPSFTGDEAGHMTKAVQMVRGLADLLLIKNPRVALQNIFYPLLQHNHPPVEFLILLPAVPFQPREFTARLIYVSVSIGALLLGFFSIKRIRGKKVALAFLSFFSISTYIVWFSQPITFGLNISGGLLASIGVLYFYEFPSRRSLSILFATLTFCLFISIDFILFLPSLLLLIFQKRKFLQSGEIIRTSILFILIVSVYYVPYIGYSFLPKSPKGAGFIHYRSYFTINRSQQVTGQYKQGLNYFLREKWDRFLGQPGIIVMWPFLIPALIFNKRKSILFLWLMLIAVLLIEVPIIPCCTVYLNILGPVALIAAETVVILPLTSVFLSVIIIINLISTKPLLLGAPNPLIYRNWTFKNDRIREVGKIVKPCFQGSQTYISTEDAWRARYYFGQSMLPAVENEDWTKEEAVKQFLKGYLDNAVVLIHIHVPQINPLVIEKAKLKAKRTVQIGDNQIFIYKDC